MRDYNIDEARQILKFHKGDIEIIPHVFEKWLDRDFNINYLIHCLIEEVPLSISKTMTNRFKLVYPHETKESKDLYIIIEIDDYENIKVMTAYPKDKWRRKRER